MPFRANGRNGMGTGALLSGSRSDSGSSERSFGKGGVEKRVARIVQFRISGQVIPEFDPVGDEIEKPVRSRIVLDVREVRTERRIDDVVGIAGRIEHAPAGAGPGDVLNHEELRFETEVYERTVGVAVPHVASEFRETGNLRPEVRYVILSGDVVVGRLVRVEIRHGRNAVESADSGCRRGSGEEPRAPWAVGIGSAGLVYGLMVRRPVVIPLGVVVAVEVLREIHRRNRSERMRNLARIRTVSGIRDDVESGQSSLAPIPSDERPSSLVDVHVDSETVAIERSQRGSGGFSKRGIRSQNLVRSTVRIEHPVRVNGVSRLTPNEVRTEGQSTDILC